MQTQPSEIIERVARGIAGEYGWQWDDMPDERDAPSHGLPDRNEFRQTARAAIAAMREPSEAMSAAGMRGLYGGYRQGNERVLELWRAMIDEAMGA